MFGIPFPPNESGKHEDKRPAQLIFKFVFKLLTRK